MSYQILKYWRWWLRLLWRGALAMIVVLILSHLGLSLLAMKRLHVAQASLVRAGAPLEESEVIPHVPPAENAAPYDQAAALVLYAGMPLPETIHDLGLPSVFATLLDQDERKDPWNDAAKRHHALAVLTTGRYEQVHTLLVEGAQLPRSVFLVDWSLCYRVKLPQIPELMAMVKLECLRAQLLFLKGDTDSAAEDLWIAGRLTQHLFQCPTEYSLAIACNRWTTIEETVHRMLDSGHLTEALIEAARSALDLPDLWRQAARDVDFERVMFGEPAFAELYPWTQYPVAASDRAMYETVMLAEREAFMREQSPDVRHMVVSAPSIYLMTKTGISEGSSFSLLIEHTQRRVAMAMVALKLQELANESLVPENLDRIFAQDGTLAKRLRPVHYLRTQTGWQLDALDPPKPWTHDWHWAGYVPSGATSR